MLTPAEKWLVILGLWLVAIGEWGLLCFLIRRAWREIRDELRKPW